MKPSTLVGTAMAACVVLTLGVMACESSPPMSGGVQIEDGTYELRVDRVLGGDRPLLPPFDETHYQAVQDGPVYRVIVSAAGEHVSVEGEREPSQPFVIEGERVSSDDEFLLYKRWRASGDAEVLLYDMHFFAGGHLTVRCTADGLQGELQVYGSGVPVISSEIGKLVKVP